MSGSSRKFARRSAATAPAATRTDHDIDLFLFRRGLYYSRVWFLSRYPEPRDVFCVLKRQLPDGAWQFQYRFRYYEDRKTFDSNDRKSFYSGTFPNVVSDAEVLDKVNEAIRALEALVQLDAEVTVIESDDPDVIISKLNERPYLQMRSDGSGVVQ